MNDVTRSNGLSSQALPHRYPDHRISSIGENPYGATIKSNISPPAFFVSVIFTFLRKNPYLGLEEVQNSSRAEVCVTFGALSEPYICPPPPPHLVSISSPLKNLLYTRERLNAVALDDQLGCDKPYVRKVDSPWMRTRGTSSIELVPLAE